MDKIKLIESEGVKKEVFNFNVGDTLRVYLKIVEQDKERIQLFEGAVIRKRGSGFSSTFTVRRVSYGEGAERVFPLYSPAIERIEIIKPGKTRRAKLYYLRSRIGKKSKVEEREYPPEDEPQDRLREETKEEGV
jgi:large subunit ribosomal protein L19